MLAGGLRRPGLFRLVQLVALFAWATGVVFDGVKVSECCEGVFGGLVTKMVSYGTWILFGLTSMPSTLSLCS